jgi:SAM-dependent methyltransferase
MPIPLWLLGLTLLIGLSWRVASRRHSIPCPVWLRWLVELDNPFTRTKRAAVIALDIQPGMLRRARDKVRRAGLDNIRFVAAGLGDGALERDGFDRALLVTVLGEIPDRRAALKEIRDSLKTGGRLAVTEIVSDPHFQRRKAVERLAEAVGFKEKAFFGNRIAYTMILEKAAPPVAAPTGNARYRRAWNPGDSCLSSLLVPAIGSPRPHLLLRRVDGRVIAGRITKKQS